MKNVLFYHFCVLRVLVAQSCLTLCDPMDYSALSSSVHGILQARILEWVAIGFSRGSSWPRDQTQVSHIVDRFFTVWAKAAHKLEKGTFVDSPENISTWVFFYSLLSWQRFFIVSWSVFSVVDVQYLWKSSSGVYDRYCFRKYWTP